MNGNDGAAGDESSSQSPGTITLKCDEEETMFERGSGPGTFEPASMEELRAAFQLAFDALRGREFTIEREVHRPLESTSELLGELAPGGTKRVSAAERDLVFRARVADGDERSFEMRCIESLAEVLSTEQLVLMFARHTDAKPRNVFLIRLLLREVLRRLSAESPQDSKVDADGLTAEMRLQVQLSEAMLRHVASPGGLSLCEAACQHESLLVELLPVINRAAQFSVQVDVMEAADAIRKLIAGAMEMNTEVPYFDYSFMSSAELVIGLVDKDVKFQDLLLRDPARPEASQTSEVQRVIRGFVQASSLRIDDLEFCLYASEAVHALCRRHTKNTRVLCEVTTSDECLGMVNLLKMASARLRQPKVPQNEEEMAFGLCNVLCFLIGLIAFASDSCKKALTRHGVLPVVLKHTAELPDSAEVQVSGSNAILGLVYQHAENCAAFREAEGVEVVLQAMDAHADDLDVQESGCQVLSVISMNDTQSRDLLTSAEAVRVLLNAMVKHRCHQDAANLIANLFSVVSAIAEGGKASQDLVAQEEGLEVLLQAMKEHPFEESVQQHGCCVLGSLGDHNEKIRQQLEQLGAIQVVTIALAEFKNAERVQSQGQWALDVLKSPQANSFFSLW